MEDLREELLRHAALFEDPRAYVAGVEDALAAMAGPTPVPPATP